MGFLGRGIRPGLAALNSSSSRWSLSDMISRAVSYAVAKVGAGDSIP